MLLKQPFKKMLGIYEAPWELIREDTFVVLTAADIGVSVDRNGNTYELTDVAVVIVMPTQDAAFSKGDNGKIRFRFGSGSDQYKDIFTGGWARSAGESGYTASAMLTQSNGLLCMQASQAVENSSTLTNVVAPVSSIELLSSPIAVNHIEITAVTGSGKYYIYGKRRWK